MYFYKLQLTISELPSVEDICDNDTAIEMEPQLEGDYHTICLVYSHNYTELSSSRKNNDNNNHNCYFVL